MGLKDVEREASGRGAVRPEHMPSGVLVREALGELR